MILDGFFVFFIATLFLVGLRMAIVKLCGKAIYTDSHCAAIFAVDWDKAKISTSQLVKRESMSLLCGSIVISSEDAE